MRIIRVFFEKIGDFLCALIDLQNERADYLESITPDPFGVKDACKEFSEKTSFTLCGFKFSHSLYGDRVKRIK